MYIRPSKVDQGARWCAIALGFTIPISIALDNLLCLAFIVLWMVGGDLKNKWLLVRRHPVALMALLFGLVILLGTLWSSGTTEQLTDASVDALRIMMIGLFAVTFLDASTRDRAQFAFLCSSAIVLVLSFSIWSGVADDIPGLKGRPDDPVVFKFHITHSVLMAAAALLFALHAMDARNRGARILMGGLSIAAVIDVFLLIPGRTGQLALAVTIVYLAIARFKWRGGAIAAATLAIIVGVAWLTPDSVLHKGGIKALKESAAWEVGEAQSQSSSVGMRLEFYANALELIGEHPVIGVGSGGFRSAYEAKVRGTQMHVADHPHNAFLLVGAELGLIGLAVLLILLQTQWRTAGSLPSFNERTAARGMVLLFITASLVSSTFNDHTEGLFYAWVSGLLFATVQRPTTEET